MRACFQERPPAGQLRCTGPTYGQWQRRFPGQLRQGSRKCLLHSLTPARPTSEPVREPTTNDVACLSPIPPPSPTTGGAPNAQPIKARRGSPARQVQPYLAAFSASRIQQNRPKSPIYCRAAISDRDVRTSLTGHYGVLRLTSGLQCSIQP